MNVEEDIVDAENVDTDEQPDINNETKPKFVQLHEKEKLGAKKGNWRIWKMKIASILKGYKCFDIIVGDRLRPRRSGPKCTEWDMLQEFAFQEMMFNVEDDLLEDLKLKENEKNQAYSLWSLITEQVKKRAELDRELIQAKLEKVKLHEGDSLQEHFNLMRKLRVQGSSVDYKITDRDFCRMIIHSLGFVC